MAYVTSVDSPVALLRETIASLVRREGPDLTARQLSVFLTCYLYDGPHTVRGLAAELGISKPAISRALDRLGEFELARRRTDPLDRRSVLIHRTHKGAAFMRELRYIMAQALAPPPEALAPPPEEAVVTADVSGESGPRGRKAGNRGGPHGGGHSKRLR